MAGRFMVHDDASIAHKLQGGLVRKLSFITPAYLAYYFYFLQPFEAVSFQVCTALALSSGFIGAVRMSTKNSLISRVYLMRDGENVMVQVASGHTLLVKIKNI